MKTNSLYSVLYALIACISIAVGTARIAIASGGSVDSLIAVTPESLLTLRASERAERIAPQSVETDQGVVDLNLDGMSDQGSVALTLWDSFPTLPLCQEWSPAAADAPRFPFEVNANERLLDSLDKLHANSAGFIDWMLLHGRVVIAAEGAVSTMMERDIHVDVMADTLQEALVQIEGSHNRAYSDIPLLLRPTFPRLMVMTRNGELGSEMQFVLRAECSLREAILSILDQLENPAVTYSACETIDGKGRHYYGLFIMKRDSRDLDSYANNEESALHQSMLKECNERLDAYLDANTAELGAQGEPGVNGKAGR